MSASRSGPPGSVAFLSAQWRKGLHQRGQVTKLLRVVGHLRPWHRREGVRNEDREGRKGPVALRSHRSGILLRVHPANRGSLLTYALSRKRQAKPFLHLVRF